MPPKPKYTKDEVIAVALDAVREIGIDALTARELGRRLGTSARPIFTAFENMEELKSHVRKAALREFENYAKNFQDYTPAFKHLGMLMISYAIKEPQLFKLLFMQEHTDGQSFQNTIQDLGGMVHVCIDVMQKDYEISEAHAKILFDQLWVYTFGLCTLCAMKVCRFTEDEIAEMLGRAFVGMVMLIKSGKIEDCSVRPALNAKDVL